jgi:ribosomal protein S27E
MQPTEQVRTTHPLPPGHRKSRYLKLKATPGQEIVGTGPTTVRCSVCDATLLSQVSEANVRGLAVRCPSCGTVSMV